ncbi:TIR domain-containing protein [Poseidonibacter lekithochrous]|uniref:TIR domain-containing protein n=1 Tax=Poseidonibacter lekithochrous TaxID=1904463 RepID=UPI0008FC7935|nr:TIR domain-containing protein [Poseidonibacter lekithochrous]QKJ22615.1 TIR-like domain-containing protein [Poseidonibacter lekithochrous]
MPNLKNRAIFISHAWGYNAHYDRLVNWFNEEPNFSWSNYSVPSSKALPDKTSAGLSRGMTRQINPTNVVVILGGMYATHSAWIDYEIREAQRLGKTIIGVKPWGQERVPKSVRDASICEPVGWNRSSIINAIRTHS